jgi:hypothetical protein
MAHSTFIASLGLVVALSIPASALAESMRIRGEVVQASPSEIDVKGRQGQAIDKVMLSDKTAYLAVTKADIEAIAPGEFVGVAGVPQAGGKIKAIGVMIFPESARGSHEGHFPWDLGPESTMTNATVGDVTQAGDGREMQVTYQGGAKTIEIVDQTSIARFAPADASIAVPGARTTVIAERTEDGMLMGRVVLIGKDGFTPPN